MTSVRGQLAMTVYTNTGAAAGIPSPVHPAVTAHVYMPYQNLYAK